MQPSTEKIGGGVPNSYKYRAESTTLRLSRGRVLAERGRARSGPHGRVLTAICRVRMAKPKGQDVPGVVRWHGGYAYLT